MNAAGLAYPQESVGAAKDVLTETAVVSFLGVTAPSEVSATGGVVVTETTGSGVGASLAESLVCAVYVGNVGTLAHIVGRGFEVDGGLAADEGVLSKVRCLHPEANGTFSRGA